MMTKQELEILRLDSHPEYVTELINCVEELLERIAQLEAQVARGGAVVVPEDVKIIAHDGLILIGSNKARQDRHNVVGSYFDRLGNLQEIRNGSLYNLLLQKLPASQVLQPGMVAVDREELEALKDLLTMARVAAHAVEDEGECDMSGICKAVFACDSLRNAQAGEVKL